jgi:alkylhydroperoxidase family enzyme
MASTGKLSPELKAKLAWTAARQNRAWYAVGNAQQRLKKLGMGEDAIYALDADKPGASPAEQQALLFCRKLTATPQQITDADIAGLRKHFSDNEVAEIVQTTCVANMFDRFTEVLNLQLESS